MCLWGASGVEDSGGEGQTIPASATGSYSPRGSAAAVDCPQSCRIMYQALAKVADLDVVDLHTLM